jgi:hypothetical protein
MVQVLLLPLDPSSATIEKGQKEGDYLGVGEDGERGLRWLVYIDFVCPPVLLLPERAVVFPGSFGVEESRHVFPGGGCLVEAKSLWWNKFVRSAFHSASICFGAGSGGRGRRESSGSGGLVPGDPA